MKYLCLLAFRSVRANKVRTAVNIAVIALSVAMAVITSTFFATLAESQKQFLITSTPSDMSAEEIRQMLAQDWGLNLLQGIAMLINGIMLTVGAFLIYGAFSTGVRERAKLMAVLTTMGASDLQKAFFAVMEALILSLIGIPCGILIGLPIVYAAVQYIKPIFPTESVLCFSIDPETVLRAVLIGLAVVLFATFISIIKSMRRSVIGLAKATSGIEVRLKKTPLDWLMWKLFGKAGELALANFVNQKRNYRFLSLSYAVAMTLYVNLNLIIPYFRQNTTPTADSVEAERLLVNGITLIVNAVVIFAVINCILMIGSMFHSRKGEFAIYESIGMSTGMMYKIVALEWIFRGGYLFWMGLLGCYAVNLLLYGIMQAVAEAHAFINPMESIIHALLAAVLLTVVMTVVMITKIRRMNIVKALKESF